MRFLICFIFLLAYPSYSNSLYLNNLRYNETEAKYLAKLCAGAYGTLDSINSCLNSVQGGDSGMRTVLDSNKENCDVFNNPCENYIAASEAEKVLYVVFRGTKTDSQLLLEGWSSTMPGDDFFGIGSVNSYFMKGHNLLWNDTLTILVDPTYSDYNVIFTGHSLGGALAALAAARSAVMALRPTNKMRLVTFGEPRVGNRLFAQNFDTMFPYSYRVVYRQDIVPHMPGCTKDRSNPSLKSTDSLPCDPYDLYGPYHHGLEIWYPESMAENSYYMECTGQPIHEDFSCSDQYKFSVKKYSQYISDHRHYFGVRIPEYGKTGCNDSFPEGY